jgi:hypothetical protein
MPAELGARVGFPGMARFQAEDAENGRSGVPYVPEGRGALVGEGAVGVVGGLVVDVVVVLVLDEVEMVAVVVVA